ncbi:hypothetical protein [Nocardioides sp. W7]|nr:hypothetical protein [Nocardioides sp. W7]
MTTSTLEDHARPDEAPVDSDLFATAFIWFIPAVGFVAALLGLG